MLGRLNFLLLALLYLPTQVYCNQQIAMNIQAQEACQKEFFTHCISKCQDAGDTGCGKACEQQATNQCIEAGE